MTNTLPSQSPPSWGERIALVDKGLQYLFSINLEFLLDARSYGTTREGLLAAVVGRPDAGGSMGFTFHVMDEVLARLWDGTVCNVPLGHVTRMSDRIVIGYDGVANLDGRILLDVEGPMSIAYTGVATFPGGADRVLTAALPSLSRNLPIMGSAFISMRTECPRTKFRWMVVNQLFGFGRVVVQPVFDALGNTNACSLSFSYDVHSAGAET